MQAKFSHPQKGVLWPGFVTCPALSHSLQPREGSFSLASRAVMPAPYCPAAAGPPAPGCPGEQLGTSQGESNMNMLCRQGKPRQM